VSSSPVCPASGVGCGWWRPVVVFASGIVDISLPWPALFVGGLVAVGAHCWGSEGSGPVLLGSARRPVTVGGGCRRWGGVVGVWLLGGPACEGLACVVGSWWVWVCCLRSG
jgi:hypothetical protein